MKYFFSNSILPKDSLLCQRIETACEEVFKKLEKLNVDRLGISEYNRMFLGSYIKNLRGALQVFSYPLTWALFKQKPLDQIVLVDYGGGCGLLSILAKEIGVNTVLYNDIYDVSCHDAELIAKAVHNEAQGYVNGDINELVHYVKKNYLSVDIVVSHDVIEHIHDLEEYVRKLKLLSNNAFRLLAATTANCYNPLMRRMLTKKHLEVEYFDRKKTFGYKERDSLRSYFALRKQIITDYDPTLSLEVTEQIAKTTRGLTKPGIERCIREYREHGRISYSPDHPTNSCDPYTGNWNERFMKTGYLKSLFQREGFDLSILGGYYAYTRKMVVQLPKAILNGIISILRQNKFSLFFAPFFMVYATLNEPNRNKLK